MKLLFENFRKFINEVKQVSWNSFPKIGWWLDSDPITFYHGTHMKNLDYITKNGLTAPTTGHTANAVSLALEPNTGLGYAVMSGAGSEQEFRKFGQKPKITSVEERIVFILNIPRDIIQQNAIPERGAMQSTKGKLTNRDLYDAWVEKNGTGNDQEYYAITEIRLPSPVDPKYIVGYMVKGK